jgi:di/tricarboxylate transporter
MTIPILVLLIVVIVAMILFSFEKFPADMVALGIILFITVSGLVSPQDAFAGFGSDAVLMIAGLLILTAALSRTGAVEIMGSELVRLTGNNNRRLFLLVIVAAAAVSSLISNTAATAIFIPVIIGVARKTRISTSKLLLPLAFATILSSSVTLVATSTNILVSGIMVQYHLIPLGMFELSPVGIPIVIIGLLYMFFIGRHLIPERTPVEPEFEEIGSSVYFTEVLIQAGSPLIHRTLVESGLGRDLDLTVVRVVRDAHRYLAPQSNVRLEEGDVLLVEGKRDEILKIREKAGVVLKDDVLLSDAGLQSADVRLVEAIVLIRSPLLGRTLRGMEFRDRYGLQVLAINRHGETIQSKISQVTIQLGDVLLIQGNQSNISALEADRTFRILGPVNLRPRASRKTLIAVGAFAGSLLIASLDLLPISVAVLLGVMVVFLTKCITPEEAYREIDWKLIILIGCMLGLGTALNTTGTATFLAQQIVSWFGNANPFWLLSAFFILTMLLTQPMSNQAAASVVVPIAIQTAIQLGWNPRTFAVMIAVGASCSYLTPLEPACLMVYGPGRYRFRDFLKVGALLTILIYVVAIILVPIFFPV